MHSEYALYIIPHFRATFIKLITCHMLLITRAKQQSRSSIDSLGHNSKLFFVFKIQSIQYCANRLAKLHLLSSKKFQLQD